MKLFNLLSLALAVSAIPLPLEEREPEEPVDTIERRGRKGGAGGYPDKWNASAKSVPTTKPKVAETEE